MPSVISAPISLDRGFGLRGIGRIGLVALVVSLLIPRQLRAETYAPWLTQIGISESLMSSANWGKGQVLGIVDTGIVASHAAFSAGQVSLKLSSCAALSFKCSDGFRDDNGHGSAVAAIAAGGASPMAYSGGGVVLGSGATTGYRVAPGMILGVASNANIVAEKVLNVSGSGAWLDVSNGIRKAADAGVSVINLSLTYGNSPELVAAINYAAAKGAYIVWAGGNSNTSLLFGQNTVGLTADAIQRLILVGSVSSMSTKSSFSNVPGGGGFVGIGSAQSSYASRWIVAPGEGILAPYATAGTNAWAAWTGTSMAAPMVSGSLALLQSAWPILKTRGTAASLLLSTAKDLGNAGNDSIYGTGLVNLTAAFQPYSSLTVALPDGSATSISNSRVSVNSRGALGIMASMKSLLSNYPVFDGYARNFSANLSGLIQASSASVTLNPIPRYIKSGPGKMMLTDGVELISDLEFSEHVVNKLDLSMANMHESTFGRGFAVVTNRRGDALAFGHGAPSGYAFAKTLYGDDDIALMSSRFQSLSIESLSQGGSLMAYGGFVGEGTRFALTANTTKTPTPEQRNWMTAEATNLGFGLAHNVTDRIKIGTVLSALSEKHGLLGTTYDPDSILGFGDMRRTTSLKMTLNGQVSYNKNIQIEFSESHSKAALGSGLISEAGNIRANSAMVTWMHKGAFLDDDQLTLAFIRPLRVTSGSAFLSVPEVSSETGEFTFNKQKVSLVPSGREENVSLGYNITIGKEHRFGLQGTLIKDSMHIPGLWGASVGVNFLSRF